MASRDLAGLPGAALNRWSRYGTDAMGMSTAQDEHGPAGAPGPARRLLIEMVADPVALSRLETEWTAVYDADPEAQFFLSWNWMRSHLEQRGKDWFVLAARTASEPTRYVGFLPLRFGNTDDESQQGKSLVTAGTPVADYTGLICLPEYQKLTIPGFAELIKRFETKLGWSELRLANFRASETRRLLFLARFAGEEFRIKSEKRFVGDDTDNYICPSIDLPGSWEEYLTRCVSSNMRQKLRRLERQMERPSDFSLRHATADTIEADLEAVLRYWGDQWAERKGSSLDAMKKQSFTMLMRSFRSGCLFVPVMLRDGAVVAGLAIFVDEVKKSYLFYLAGRDRSISSPPPGLLLHAHSIRHAVSRGFRTYDFLRGNEPYKFSFGAGEHLIRTLIIKRARGAPEVAA